jgi:hypothetical protein
VPTDAYERSLAGDAQLVSELEEQFAAQYHPQPSLSKLKLVL